MKACNVGETCGCILPESHDDEHQCYHVVSMRTMSVLELVREERLAQTRRYGTNATIKDGTGPHTRWLLPFTGKSATEIESELRNDYLEYEEEAGKPTWVHLVREEIAEAFTETDEAKLETELIQVAALCVSWVEKIRARAE